MKKYIAIGIAVLVGLSLLINGVCAIEPIELWKVDYDTYTATTGTQGFETSSFAGYQNSIIIAGTAQANTATPQFSFPDVWYTFRFIVNGVVLTGYRFSDGWDLQLVTVTFTNTDRLTSGYVRLGVGAADRVSVFDYIRVRKYASSEPSTNLGSEDTRLIPVWTMTVWTGFQFFLLPLYPFMPASIDLFLKFRY